MRPFSGKTALVTGGARRIGAAFSRRLAREGANVVLHCNKSLAEAVGLACELEKNGAKCFVAQGDLSLPGGGERLFAEAMSLTGGELDIVVNSASSYEPSSYETVTPQDIERQMRTHLSAPLELLRGLYRIGDGKARSAVNILDSRIRTADPSHAAYLLSKQALSSLTSSLALCFAPQLRINAIAPGAVLAQDGEEAGFERLKQFNPMHALGTLEGLCDALVFLLKSDFVLGQTIYYDGGYHLKATPAEDA